MINSLLGVDETNGLVQFELRLARLLVDAGWQGTLARREVPKRTVEWPYWRSQGEE